MRKSKLRSSLALAATFVAGLGASQAYAFATPQNEQHFVVQRVTQLSNGDVRFAGQFIVDGAVVVSPSDTPDEPDVPEIDIRFRPLEPWEIKWILGPNGEGREFAESMGYETVELDDFSYPPRP